MIEKQNKHKNINEFSDYEPFDARPILDMLYEDGDSTQIGKKGRWEETLRTMDEPGWAIWMPNWEETNRLTVAAHRVGKKIQSLKETRINPEAAKKSERRFCIYTGPTDKVKREEGI